MDQESRRFLTYWSTCLPTGLRKMMEHKGNSHKVLAFVAPPLTMEGKLEKWFRGVVQSNLDLMTALERLSDSYRTLLGDNPMTERDQAVLLAVQITLKNARNAQSL